MCVYIYVTTLFFYCVGQIENIQALVTMAELLLTTEHPIGTPYFIVPSCRECIVKNAEDGVVWFVVRHYNLPRGKYEYPKKKMYIYSKTCLKRNAIVPVFFFLFHRFPFCKGLCFNKTKYKKYDRLGLQWRNNLK